MKRILIFLSILTILSCGKSKSDEANDALYESNKNCFKNDPLNTISWASDKFKLYTKPKSGRVVIYISFFKDEYFLVFENGYDNGPIGSVLDCDGISIGARGITYNDFLNNSKKIKVLINSTY